MYCVQNAGRPDTSTRDYADYEAVHDTPSLQVSSESVLTLRLITALHTAIGFQRLLDQNNPDHCTSVSASRPTRQNSVHMKLSTYVNISHVILKAQFVNRIK